MVLLVLYDRSSLSDTSKSRVCRLQTVLLLIMFSVGNSRSSLCISPSAFFPLFQNKLDSSLGGAIQGNPLEEKKPRQWRDISFLGRGGRKDTWRRMGERQRPLQPCSLGSFPFLQSRSSWLAPFTAGGAQQGPTGAWPDGGLALF